MAPVSPIPTIISPRFYYYSNDKSNLIIHIISVILSILSILLISWAIHRRCIANQRRRCGIPPGVTVIVDPRHPTACTGYGPVPTGAVPMGAMPPAYSEPAPPYVAPPPAGGANEAAGHPVQPVPQEPSPSYYAPTHKP